jgi:ABC-2 type transport system ATP-binding protein
MPEQVHGNDKIIIRVENLEHSYGAFKAVDGISFSVKRGEIFSFLGPNGAGKSTAINVLITLLAKQKGTATVDGYDVTNDPQKVRESIGIVFQDITLDRDMTVWEILEFHGRLYNMPREDRKKRIDELLRLVQLDAKKDERTKNLSGGMKRRLEIARGLMTRPKVLFLDEPTIGLDPQTRMRMWEYIKGVNDDHLSYHPLHGRGRPALGPDQHYRPGKNNHIRKTLGTQEHARAGSYLYGDKRQ